MESVEEKNWRELTKFFLGLDDDEEARPSEEGTTTDKSGVTDPSGNQDTLKEEPKESNDDDGAQNTGEIQQQNDELIESKCIEVKQEPNDDDGDANDDDEGQNGDSKQDNTNQEDEDDEEEVEDKDEGSDQMEIEKSTKDPDNQEGSQLDEKLSYLGRNRRVRQKNRYFLDFHCVDLTKGARSNRDDYDAFTTTATTTSGTRSSNRRSTTDSTRGQQEEGPEVFETRYCRKCSSKTPHDFDGGCQACLYKKIVESSKRQKPSSQRSKSSTTKQQNDNELESTSSSATPAPPAPQNKRKSNKQGGSTKNKYLNQKYRHIADSRSDSSNDNNNGANNNNVNPTPHHQAPDLIPTPTLVDDTIISPNTITENSSGGATSSNDSNHNNNNNIKLPKLDSWTPDEVAEYIMSKGFAHEAELFKTQSVDGISLLLMQRTDFTYGLKIKLGPALKIYDQVCKLKREFFKTVPVTQH